MLFRLGGSPIYWKLGGWTQLSEDESKKFVRHMESHISAAGSDTRQAFLFVYDPSDEAAANYPKESNGLSKQSDQLFVQTIFQRELPFYPVGWFIYRLICALPNRPELEGYENAVSVFVIRGPVADENMNDDENADRYSVALDWTSTPIHALNRKISLDLSDAPSDIVADYLIFFGSFLGGDPGPGEAIAPFILPQSKEDLGWDESLVALDEMARERDLVLLPKEAPDTEGDPFDLGEDSKPEGDVNKPDGAREEPNRSGERLSEKQLRDAVAAAFGEFDANPTPWPDPDRDDDAATFRALVWYEGELFRSAFRVAADGMVEMSDDAPVARGTRLPAALWQVQRLPSRISLLCRQRARQVISRDDLVQQMQGSRPVNGTDEARIGISSAEVTLRSLRIHEDIQYFGKVMHRIVFDDVEFAGRVDLSDCTFERSLVISDCRFLHDLSIKDATVQGSFKLHRTTIEGAYQSRPDQRRPALPPALAMDGLRVGRLLSADRLVVNGRVRARSLRVGGLLRALGLRVRRRVLEQEKPAVALSHANVDGPIDFGAHGHSSELRDPDQVRTRISGPVMLDGLQAGEVTFRGVQISGDLDLSACRIRGLLDLTPSTIREDRQFYWRTRIDGEMTLRNGDCLEVRIRGASIGSHLSLINAHVRGALFGTLWLRYQTRIFGDLVASGATVASGLELEGARIDGELVFITGRCGRLTATVGHWWRPGQWPPEVRFEPVRASGIILSEVEFVAGANFTGLQLDGQKTKYSKGGIVTSSVRFGGRLSFWHAETEHILRQTALADLQNKTGHELTRSINNTIGEIRAAISGDLDLRGIVLEGAAWLDRLRVAERICVDNARIEGDLRTHGDLFCSAFSADRAVIRGEACLGGLNVTGPLCLDNAEIGGNLSTDSDLSCHAFSANATVIHGDADLRRLRVCNGRLIARGIRVDGMMLLASPPERTEDRSRSLYTRIVRDDEQKVTQDGSQSSDDTPSMDLDGMRAARLVVSGKNVARRNDGIEINLARGQCGQLSIVDFDKASDKFPTRMRLSPVEVGDWQIKPEVEALPLLEAAEFDRGLYVEIERRLARIGMNRLANKIYRKMIWRTTREPQLSPRSWIWAVLNGGFSRQGTWPLLMAFWLVVSVLPTSAVFSLWQNIQFVDQNSPQEEMAKYWRPLRGIGLAVSYAVPIFGGARSEQARARPFGPTCLPPWPWSRGRPDRPAAAEPGAGASEPPRAPEGSSASVSCPGSQIDLFSPHDIALSLSFVQFGLWLLIAASLPAIVRRRN